MSTPRTLSEAARAELDRTLDSLTWRALEETAVTVAVVGLVAAKTAGTIAGRLLKGHRHD